MRTSGCSQVVASAPTAAPDIVGRTIGRIAPLSSMFDRLNPTIPVGDCYGRPSLLVPLAWSAGIPSSISAGTVTIAPPPSTVLMNPPTTPANPKMDAFQKVK